MLLETKSMERCIFVLEILSIQIDMQQNALRLISMNCIDG